MQYIYTDTYTNILIHIHAHIQKHIQTLLIAYQLHECNRDNR